MCGIAGLVDYNGDLTVQKDVPQRMVDTLKGRGPDAEGFWHSTHAVLGHRRLIVVDPAGGRSRWPAGRAGRSLY